MEAKGNIFKNSFYENDIAAGKKPPMYRGKVKDTTTGQEYDVALWANEGKDGKPGYLGMSIKDAKPREPKPETESRTEQIFPDRNRNSNEILAKDIPNPKIEKTKNDSKEKEDTSNDLPF